jgi:hypothetical protein
MDGEVTKIDKQTGKITIKTASGPVELQFPAAALENVKTGDQVTLSLSMKGANAPTTSGPTTRPQQ